MNEQHMGSNFDDFLKEEGIYEECTTGALQKINLWLLKERRDTITYFTGEHNKLWEEIDLCRTLNTNYAKTVKSQAELLQKYRNATPNTTEYPKLGAICRTTEGAPARYIGNGIALYISCSDNDLVVSRYAPATGEEKDFPLPSDETTLNEIRKHMVKL